MIKISESMIKIVNCNRRKWLIRLTQNENRMRARCLRFASSQHISSSVKNRNLTLCTLFNGTWKPCITPVYSGRSLVRLIDSNASTGYPKKRMLECNAQDTSFNVTRYESKPTSDWSLIVGEFVELMKKESK